ncbi:DNA-binding response regulator [Candidatus Falkowbacteria bacterium CG_4_10_14_0_2_um_filter_41_15]|uniref:DNA-binding response regulator n=3 Tax=Candidatus Falkowiibacteriota TaxID=1752728 RepID=A0A1J4TAG8_9BACT|nr:MAG: DNA-binding response regulator [Candidatus Falkowbacteria bacterium CG1_02_41_21]PIZ09774.1 MAG: DNA-binding response regulator [Candidatus Falkowbacteria bacterium CG_4_10_14_0_8_um_filter_41_36]PJA10552.1 MAG: DNA-binding response regulator [Candidatus Falkowbacteria bacterium CG_4_10_14_0_2_um_filter_41_15]
MRILLIEDEKDIAEFIKINLETEFYTVDIAYDGERGSFLARTNDYDLIICDYILPKQNGPEVVKEIRQENKNVPILILSVKSEIDSKVNLFNLGVDDYLTKPFLFEELLAHVKAILRRPLKRENQILKIDDLVVDIDRHLVKRGRQTITLTRKELSLLEYLLKNRGRVISRVVIMEHVWDANADPFSNTIESHITNLRRKINLTGKKELIHTVSGRGYKVDIRK